jgi:hypothetical protein
VQQLLLLPAANLELNKMTDEQYNAICEHLQPTAEPGVKVLPLEGYKECINPLGSFDDETLQLNDSRTARISSGCAKE